MKPSIPGRRVVWLDTTSSTMLEAARLADEGAPTGTIVGAEEQTAGIGRQDHKWHSERGAGLYFTIILRLNSPVVMLALGLAVAEAMRHVTGLEPDLRWPNDVLIGERKCCGILAQMHGDCVLAGIGINVNQTSFPEELPQTATSLRLESGCDQPREELLRAVLRRVDFWIGRERDHVLEAFTRASSYAEGKRVLVEGIRGTTAGLTGDGFLKVHSDDGVEHVILAGGVRPE